MPAIEPRSERTESVLCTSKAPLTAPPPVSSVMLSAVTDWRACVSHERTEDGGGGSAHLDVDRAVRGAERERAEVDGAAEIAERVLERGQVRREPAQPHEVVRARGHVQGEEDGEQVRRRGRGSRARAVDGKCVVLAGGADELTDVRARVGRVLRVGDDADVGADGVAVVIGGDELEQRGRERATREEGEVLRR